MASRRRHILSALSIASLVAALCLAAEPAGESRDPLRSLLGATSALPPTSVAEVVDPTPRQSPAQLDPAARCLERTELAYWQELMGAPAGVWHERERFEAAGMLVTARENRRFERGDWARRYIFEIARHGNPVAVVSLGSYEVTMQIMRQIDNLPPDYREFHLDGYVGDHHQLLQWFGPREPAYREVRARVTKVLQEGELGVSCAQGPAARLGIRLGTAAGYCPLAPLDFDTHGDLIQEVRQASGTEPGAASLLRAYAPCADSNHPSTDLRRALLILVPQAVGEASAPPSGTLEWKLALQLGGQTAESLEPLDYDDQAVYLAGPEVDLADGTAFDGIAALTSAGAYPILVLAYGRDASGANEHLLSDARSTVTAIARLN